MYADELKRKIVDYVSEAWNNKRIALLSKLGSEDNGEIARSAKSISGGLIPDIISHDTFAHSRRVMEVILSGVAVKSAQASQQASTISS